MRARNLPRATAVVAAAALLATTAATASATPTPVKPTPPSDGRRPLSQVFAADRGFDQNPYDYDVARALIQGVLQLKPNSPLKVIADGSVPLTVFVPKDVAFKQLVHDLLGVWVEDEAKLAKAALVLLTRSGQAGVLAAEQLLLYHVVPGKTLTANELKGMKGSWIRTAAAGNRSIRVWLDHGDVRLRDLDEELRDPTVRLPDLNAGNRQIAHGIDRVLIPVDLP